MTPIPPIITQCELRELLGAEGNRPNLEADLLARFCAGAEIEPGELCPYIVANSPTPSCAARIIEILGAEKAQAAIDALASQRRLKVGFLEPVPADFAVEFKVRKASA